jgi:uncharacterized tellurite resistance protein B-like protein
MLEEAGGGGGTPETAAVAGAVAAQVDLINKQAVQIKSSATSFKAAAGSGFHIEPEAAATLIKACEDAQHDLNKLMTQTMTIEQAPQLGKTPGANVVSKFTQNVATDNEGILSALRNLRQTLDDMISAYRKASTNYTETEATLAKLMSGK